MGLNPPFGVNAALANKFINKALEFKPKLIVLIVPQETERYLLMYLLLFLSLSLSRTHSLTHIGLLFTRLDKKNPPYDLVWEDDELLTGKVK